MSVIEKLATKADFDKAIDELPPGKLMVVDFTASWCGPCRTIAPKYEAIAKEFTDVVFYKVDVDENDEAAEAEGIQAMPTFKFYKDGKSLNQEKLQGANEAGLRERIKRLK